MFLETSASYLTDQYLPRIDKALRILPKGDLWWSPHPDATSFGNLLLHLEGNVRQWILSGLGGARDLRQRSQEFTVDHRETGEVLFERLGATVKDAAKTIRAMDVTRLSDTVVIQGFETTVEDAIYHVVEHFSWHTGQMTWIAKSRAGAGHGLAFYDEDAINEARNP